jgi:hypothetical protein
VSNRQPQTVERPSAADVVAFLQKKACEVRLLAMADLGIVPKTPKEAEDLLKLAAYCDQAAEEAAREAAKAPSSESRFSGLVSAIEKEAGLYDGLQEQAVSAGFEKLASQAVDEDDAFHDALLFLREAQAAADLQARST